jgi:hypothetical protein
VNVSGKRDLVVLGGDDETDDVDVDGVMLGRYEAPPMAGTRP